MPKLKTHGLTRLTGAVKNQFGCIPGLAKGQFHAKMADPYEFASMLVDINTYLKPRLYVMDAVTAMEGNGPRNGRPRQMNVLLFSTDPVALDAVACKMIVLNPEYVPTSAPGEKAGLGTYHQENIEIVGERVETFVCPEFDVVREPPVSVSEGNLRKFIRNRTTPRPVIDRAKCDSCGTCIKMCPVGHTALDWAYVEAGKAPKHNYANCIRCYCCQELCPQGAITINRPVLSRLVRQ
jgi:ferredoxin